MAKGSIEVISNGQSSGYVDDHIDLTSPETEVTRIAEATVSGELDVDPREAAYSGTYVHKVWEGTDRDGQDAIITLWVERGTE